MLVVTVELWPHGDEGCKKALAAMTIINEGTGSLEFGNYRCEAYSRAFGHIPAYEADGKVTNWPRLTEGVWSLVLTALQNMGY